MDGNKEMSQEKKDELIKKELEEAEFLEKELARERREEVSRMVEDLEKKTAAIEAESKNGKKEASYADKEKKISPIVRDGIVPVLAGCYVLSIMEFRYLFTRNKSRLCRFRYFEVY